ncbi:MAG TPA: hypothetical protein VN085_09560, partial [Vicinamibacterales bacterium]|nr:hypothetical protein [Vicinamibacterales bacterium]
RLLVEEMRAADDSSRRRRYLGLLIDPAIELGAGLRRSAPMDRGIILAAATMSRAREHAAASSSRITTSPD